MSSVLEPQPDPSPADELVAYLDGELAPPDCRRVESRLATDQEYREQLHELERTWEALDALPTSTVDDGFARTTIELACVAAEDDLTEHTAIAKEARRSRTRRWIAAGVAAVVVGLLAGRALIPNRNGDLVADLAAIQQLKVLPYVEDVEFLRRLSAIVAPEQLIKDQTAFERNLKELESVNSQSLDERREWIKSLPREQKADLADLARAFDDFEPASGERMRTVMADIRNANDASTLQTTLISYGQWLSRHTAGQQQQLLEDFRGLSSDKRAELVQKRIEREGEQAFRHLSPEDADALRREIFQIAKEKRPEFTERMLQGRKAGRMINLEGPLAKQTMVILVSELGAKREETTKRLIEKLSPAAQAHWENLGRGQREFGKPRQLWVWIQDAMNLKVDPEELERFFASDKVTNDQRQQLLDQPRPRMEADLERMYFRSELGIDNSGQLFGEFGEPGRLPRGGAGAAGQPRRGEGARRPDGPEPGEPAGPGGLRPRPRFGPGRPPGPGGAPDRRPDNRPDDRGRPNRPRPDGPPPPDQKQEAV